MPKRLLVTSVTAALFFGAVISAPAQATAVSLKGAGSSFANKFITSCDTATSDYTISYNPAGSGTGRTLFSNASVNFGASDAANSLTLSSTRSGNTYKYVPVVGGAIAIMLNVPGITSGQLQLDAATWAKILKGSITKWNDASIKALQTSAVAAKLPNASIRVVYRGGSSGTSENLTDYLRQNVPTIWTRAKNGTIASGNPAGRMPTGSISATNSQALVSSVKNTRNSIGYADYSDVKSSGVAFAKLKNAAGAYVAPSAASAETFLAAFGAAKYFNSSTGAVTLDFKKSIAGAYQMSLLTYMIVDAGSSPETTLKGANVRAFATYLLNTCGPNRASDLGYAAISGTLKTKALALLS